MSAIMVGLPECIKALDSIKEKFKPEDIEECLMAGAEIYRAAIEAAASPGPWRSPAMQKRLPKKPHLKESIIIYKRKDPKGAMATTAADVSLLIGPGGVTSKLKAYWGYFYEMGTRFQAAKPFVRPSFDANEAAATAATEAALARKAQEAGAGP